MSLSFIFSAALLYAVRYVFHKMTTANSCLLR